MKYFTSDWHLCHKNILYLDERPFQSLIDMQLALVENINNMAKEDDTLYMLGDIAYKNDHDQIHTITRFVESLKVKRKILIIGNHDILTWKKYIDCGFESVHSSLEVSSDHGDYILLHDPSAASCFQQKRFICGHVHRQYQKCNNVVNVGCCAWDYNPVSMTEIDNIFFKYGMGGLINVG